MDKLDKQGQEFRKLLTQMNAEQVALLKTKNNRVLTIRKGPFPTADQAKG